jgi:hypothetical protein
VRELWGGPVITGAGSDGLGRQLLFLGLDGENITRLVAGEPIRIPADRLAFLGLPPVTVWVHYRKTAGELAEDAAKLGEVARDWRTQ